VSWEVAIQLARRRNRWGLASRCRAVDDEALAGVGGERHRLEREAELPDDRVPDGFAAGVVGAHVVGQP